MKTAIFLGAVSLVASSPGSAEPAVVASPVPRASPVSLVSYEDYPASALAAGEQGRVDFRLTVAPTGRVRDCVVTASSGSAALDGATCRLMISRARFTPARDSTGSPVEGSFEGNLVWRIPGA
jgi:protein TonB